MQSPKVNIIDLRSPSPAPTATRPTLPDERYHWIRGIVAGVLVALFGLFVIWLVQRAFHLRDCVSSAAPRLQPAAESLAVEQDGTYTSHASYRSYRQFGIDANGPANHGEEITVDLPPAQHQANISVQGLGCCVFRSIDHAARYQHVDALVNMPEWMRDKNIAGGGWPEKVAQLIPRIARDRGLPVPEYLQHTGGDLEFLKMALRTGRMVCVTYNGRDGVYYRGPIAHMVNLVHLSDRWAVILDNNHPGKYLWMTPREFESRWKGNGGGWAIVLLASPPPPVPVSLPSPAPSPNPLRTPSPLNPPSPP